MTRENKYYEAGHLGLWDTPGIEISKDFNIDFVIENVSND